MEMKVVLPLVLLILMIGLVYYRMLLLFILPGALLYYLLLALLSRSSRVSRGR